MKNVEECRKEGKFGLEFIEKYSDSYKIVYSDLSIKKIKGLNLKIFKSDI